MTTDSSRFSIVVPIVGDVNLFEQTLATLLRDSGDDTEVILVHDGTYEDPYAIAGEVTLVDAQSRRLSVMLNCAIDASTREFVAVVRPGVHLPEHWQSLVQPKFDAPEVASVAPLIVSSAEETEIVAAGLKTNYGFQRMLEGDGAKIADRVFQRLRPIGPTQWAAFYRRSALQRVSHFDRSVDDQYIDLDLSLTLKRLGYRCQLATDCVATIDRPVLITKQADRAHGLSAQRAITRHGQGDSAIGRGLVSFAKEIICTPLQPNLFAQAMGRLAGMKARPGDRKFAAQIDQIKRTQSAVEKSGLNVFGTDAATDIAQSVGGGSQHNDAATSFRRAA